MVSRQWRSFLFLFFLNVQFHEADVVDDDGEERREESASLQKRRRHHLFSRACMQLVDDFSPGKNAFYSKVVENGTCEIWCR